MRYNSTRYKRSEQTSNLESSNQANGRNSSWKWGRDWGKRDQYAAAPPHAHRTGLLMRFSAGMDLILFLSNVFLRTLIYLMSRLLIHILYVRLFCLSVFSIMWDTRIWIVVECLCCVSHWWRCVWNVIRVYRNTVIIFRWHLNSILRQITSGFMLSGDIFALPQSVSFDFSYWTFPLIFVLRSGFPPSVSTSNSAEVTWNDSDFRDCTFAPSLSIIWTTTNYAVAHVFDVEGVLIEFLLNSTWIGMKRMYGQRLPNIWMGNL